MNYAVDIGIGAMIYIQSLIKIRSRIKKLVGGYLYRQTAR
jgi:hypothetical protein